MELPQRPMTILIAALGGEGGGVLADWILAAATAQDYPVQSTSIPGVAQRTGATTYYVELYPARFADLGGRRPVMPLAPAPGCVDVLLSSELLEAGRAMLNGFVTPERTTLIASTHRVYTVAEKMQMGDGRFDSDKLVEAAQAVAKRTILFDMQSLAAQSGTVISAVLFGAIAGSGCLPLTRAACEEAIRKGGKGTEASLRGFSAGYAAAGGSATASGEAAPAAEAKRPRAETNARARSLTERVRNTFPAETHALLEAGANRCAEFQDLGYAALYLDRLDPILKLERELGGAAGGYQLTAETGRFLALWMCFEDVIRVADLKSRRSRFERVRAEVQAKPGEPLHIIEYLKPGVEEAAALLPPALSKALLGWAEKRGLTHKLNFGMYVKTTSVSGFLLLRLLAALRPLRRMSARYAEEQALIERWLGSIATAAARDLGLALEIALCGRLIKGYGDTNRRGKASFLRILDTLVEGGAVAADRDRAAAIAKARDAALADPEGRGLESTLATHGIAPLPPQAKTIQFLRRPAQSRKVA
jgi:indolepyruvate ferredoxin oxidoreductase, beta subunit